MKIRIKNRIKKELPMIAVGLILTVSCEIPALLPQLEYDEPTAQIDISTTGLPGADFTYAPGTDLSFSGSNSQEGEAALALFTWDYGDDSVEEEGENTSHSFLSAGEYTVSLVVTDTNDQSGNGFQTVVINTAPQAVIDIDSTTVNEDETLYLSATTSNDSDGTITSYEWSLGDGSQTEGSTISHSYDQSGSYQVSLTVTDNDGTTNSSSITLLIEPLPNELPQAQAGDDQSIDYNTQGSTIFLDGTNSTDSDGTIESYLWSFVSLPAESALSNADLIQSTSATASFDIDSESEQAITDGSLTYTLQLEVTDNSGDSSTDQVTTSVTGVGTATVIIQ